MNNTHMTLLTGNRSTSDDGLTAWLIMRMSGLAFDHRVSELDVGARAQLNVDEETISNSLGIAGFISELVPEIWPDDSRARAHARTLAAEAFGGLYDFRTYLPLSLNEQFMPAARLLRRSAKDFAFLTEQWRRFLESNRNQGPFLFGQFSAADAFHAPLVARCVTYGLEIDPLCESYIDAVMSYPIVAEWQSLSASSDSDRHSYHGNSITAHAQASSSKSSQVGTPAPIISPAAIHPKKSDDLKPVALQSDETLELTDEDRVPFAVETKKSDTAETASRLSEPALMTPAKGKRLFGKTGKRSFQPNYQTLDSGSQASKESEPADRILVRTSRGPAIKPIGGEIRRRR